MKSTKEKQRREEKNEDGQGENKEQKNKNEDGQGVQQESNPDQPLSGQMKGPT